MTYPTKFGALPIKNPSRGKLIDMAFKRLGRASHLEKVLGKEKAWSTSFEVT